MSTLKDHWLDGMIEWEYDEEFEVVCACGRTFTSGGPDRIEDSITMWAQHVQDNAGAQK